MFLQISALTIHRAQSIVDCNGVTFLKYLKMSYIVGWISIQIAQFHRDACGSVSAGQEFWLFRVIFFKVERLCLFT